MKKLIMFAILAGAVFAAMKLAAAQKMQWQGLTETQVRDKLDQRLPPQVPADKRDAVADTVVSKMRDRGLLEAEPAESVTEAVTDVVADAAEAVDPDAPTGTA